MPQSHSKIKKPVGIAYLIGRVDHSLKYYIREQLKPIGLTVSQYTALSILAAHDSVNNAKLAELSMISPQSANEMVRIMEKKAWIIRTPHATDSRIIQIKLSDLGVQLLEEGNAKIAVIEKKMMAKLNDKQVRELLRHLLDNLT